MEQAPAPKISFVSLGCPKALVDSERIITRLRAEGYELAREHDGRRLVIVNTCGFLDSAKAGIARGDRRGAGRERQGHRHRLHGRRAGADHATRYPERARRSPARSNTRACSTPCIARCRRAHDPFVDLVPPQGIKLTPRHYAYLKISEGCNNRCTFCIIPKLRGDLVSRPAADVLREAEKLVEAGVKELLVISQDTSAYGVDIKYADEPLEGPRGARAVLRPRARTGRARRLGAAALRLSLSACRRGHPADGRGQGAALSRHPVPARLARRAEAHEAPGGSRTRRWSASRAGARSAPTSPSARPSSSASPARPRRISRSCSTGSTRRSSTASAASNTSRSRGAAANDLADAGAGRGEGGALAPLHGSASRRSRARRLKRKVGTRQQVIIDEVGADRRQGPHARPTRRRSTARSMSRAAGRCASATSSPSRSSAPTPTICTAPWRGSEKVDLARGGARYADSRTNSAEPADRH